MTNREVTVKGKTYRMDGYVQDNLDKVKQVIKNDWDFVYIIDGKEGSGKSAFAQQLAYYLTEGNFDISDIVFNVDDFKQKLRTQKKFHAVIWDEAYVGINSGSALATINKEVTRLLMECRQRNLFIFIVMPTFWDLSKYAKLHRANGVWHVHTNEKLHRGYFRYYKNGAIKTMERQTSKYKYDHPAKYQSFYGRFPKGYMVDEEEYRKKKDTSFQSEIIKKEVKDVTLSKYDWKTPFFKLVNYLALEKMLTLVTISSITKVNYGSLKELARKQRLEELSNCQSVGENPPQ